MSAGDLVREAIEELYALDPDEFMDLRTALAARARTTDKAAGREIAALRKPTHSAYALNQLVRSDPEAATRLARLGDELRSAQEALDGARMRELSTLRRGLVEELADQAFQVTEQRSPAPALRDEVVSTLNAAVADGSVVEQLGSATLVKAARWDGVGFASPPELSVIRSAAPRRPREAPAAGKPKAATGTSERTVIKGRRSTRVTPAQDRAQQRAGDAAARAEAKAEEQRQRRVLADARRAVKDAGSALAKAVKAEEDQQTRVRLLHEQLTDARRRLDEMRIDVRRAENRERKAQQALDRL